MSEANQSKCSACGRALKNPKWVERGIGPICARKAGIKKGDFALYAETRRSNYSVTSVHDGIVWIVDNNIGRSVTNDAENVTMELNQQFPHHRIIYRDTIGQWDELVHTNGVFVKFKPARDMAPDVAIAKATP